MKDYKIFEKEFDAMMQVMDNFSEYKMPTIDITEPGGKTHKFVCANKSDLKRLYFFYCERYDDMPDVVFNFLENFVAEEIGRCIITRHMVDEMCEILEN